MTDSKITRSLNEFEDEINEFEQAYSTQIQLLKRKFEGDYLYRIEEADWYVRGSFYYLRRMHKHYNRIMSELGSRILHTLKDDQPIDAFIMYMPETQHLYFEFYSLINLIRISFDSLRNILKPTFLLKCNNLPKSINRILKGKTDCPIYLEIAYDKNIDYLIDLRNCIVHYRSFAISDNSLALREGLKEERDWPKSFAKMTFRYMGENKVSGNIYLPDEIYIYENNNKKIASFTYNNKINIISACRDFTLTCAARTLQACELVEDNEPRYYFKKK